MSRTPNRIDHAKAACGFQAASKRPRCGNCQEIAENSPGFWACGRHGFAVTVYAVCNDWESAVEARKPVPNGSKTEIRPHGAETGSGALEAASPEVGRGR